MKILVCFKIVNDLESVMERDFENASLEHFDIQYTTKQINGYDEAALECALRIKDSDPESIIVDAITIGNGNYDLFYKNMFAVGINSIIQIQTGKEYIYHPKTIARVLSQYCEGYDYILMGGKNSLGENGLTQYRLSKELNIPCLNHVISAKLNNGEMIVKYEKDDCERTVRIHSRCIFALENSDSPYLRVATLREKMRVKSRKPIIIESNMDPLENCVPIKLYCEQKDKDCFFIHGDSVEEKVRILVDTVFREQ